MRNTDSFPFLGKFLKFVLGATWRGKSWDLLHLHWVEEEVMVCGSNDVNSFCFY
jgi:hypothetical protein